MPQGTPKTAPVLIVVGDASETLDTLVPYYRLIEAGLRPLVIGPKRGTYQMVMHEVRPGWTITKEWEGYTIEAEQAFREVDPDAALGVFYSGGRAPESAASKDLGSEGCGVTKGGPGSSKKWRRMPTGRASGVTAFNGDSAATPRLTGGSA